LIANREEYLRHSTLNYTVQQKQYNNRLTERMIELAAEQGFSFDQEEFSFVTVRDRIRCYYKVCQTKVNGSFFSIMLQSILKISWCSIDVMFCETNINEFLIVFYN
jgi:hypothetical protein